MKGMFITLALVVIINTQIITASLKLIQYEPYIFQLQFSEPVQRPAFQLLRNHLNQINYTLLTIQPVSKIFYIQPHSIQEQLSSTQYLENYQIIFNSPLKIGTGRLGVRYFMIKSTKEPVIIEYTQVFGILVLVIAYFLVIFSYIAQRLLEFLRVYCLIMFIDSSKSTLYVSFAKGLLMMNPNTVTQESFQNQFFLYFILPLLLVILTGAIGFIMKRCIKEKKNILGKILYQTFVYDTFVTTSIMFITPIFFNSTAFFHLIGQGTLIITPGIKNLCYISSVFGIITVFVITYLLAYEINPKINQSEASWGKYIKSQEFNNFRKIHEHIHLKPWYKRNEPILIILIKIVSISFFFLSEIFTKILFFLYFIELLYIFTIRPFKNELYVNIMVVLRLSSLTFYGVVIIGQLYFSLGDITLTFLSVQKYILARTVIFLLIVLEFNILIGYELFIKFSNFNYQVRLIRQQNEFKLKIIQKEKEDNQSTQRGYKVTIDSSDNSYTRGRIQSSVTNATSVRKKIHTQSHATESRFSGNKSTLNEYHVEKELKEYLKGSHSPKRSRIKGEIQMVDLSKSKLMKSVQKDLSQTQHKSKKKWKKESLLVQISKNK